MPLEFLESDSVRVLPGVGPTTQAALHNLGIDTLHNVLEHYPRQYIDGTAPLPLDSLPLGELVAVRATVMRSRQVRVKGRSMVIIEAWLSDASGELKARWYNQKFVLAQLAPGTSHIFIGSIQQQRGEKSIANPIIEANPAILSVYGQTAGVTSKMLRGYTHWILDHVRLDESFELPEEIRYSEGLPNRAAALRALHAPAALIDVEFGRRYAGFAELFWFFAQLLVSRRGIETGQAAIIPLATERVKHLLDILPFQLTPGQKRALWEIMQDMGTGKPMTRLLNGDVGSGKTLVAALAAAVVSEAGYQSVILVPTEILATQHAESIARLLGLKVSLWTAAIKEDIERAEVVVGTQALLQEGFSLPRLSLVVIDEQHRFGVRQRRLLRAGADGSVPHLLTMTATPIPRSLALALFGDLKMSTIPEKPADRLPVQTHIIHPHQRDVMHERILAELGQGHQVFVVCALVEKAEDETDTSVSEQKAAQEEVVRLRQENPEYGAIDLIHGKMKAKEKRALMERMALGEIQVLVATSVLEVGIDVPNATVMVIEGAERFGLSQLHQLRGRVGRGDSQSYCFLCPALHSATIERRLHTIAENQDGFVIAEADLAQRGPGDLAGLAQAGVPEFSFATLGNVETVGYVKGIVERYGSSHPQWLQELAGREYTQSRVGLE